MQTNNTPMHPSDNYSSLLQNCKWPSVLYLCICTAFVTLPIIRFVLLRDTLQITRDNNIATQLVLWNPLIKAQNRVRDVTTPHDSMKDDDKLAGQTRCYDRSCKENQFFWVVRGLISTLRNSVQLVEKHRNLTWWLTLLYAYNNL